MIVHLGLSGIYSHDSAACLIIDGVIIAAIEEERFTHEKHTGNFPINAIKFCLDKGNIKPEQVDIVSFPFDNSLRFEKSLYFTIYDFFHSDITWVS